MLLFDSVESTNDVVAELARNGAPNLTLALAEHQTRGRGRESRTWVAPAGSALLFSVLFRLQGGGSCPGCAPIRVGLAVAGAIGDARVKWPNDVVIEGQGKVAGILCEGVFGAHVVAGIGINVTAAPALDNAACLGNVSRSALMTRLVGNLVEIGARLTEPLTDMELQALESRDVLANRPVEVMGELGVARGIAADGALLLEQHGGQVRKVYSGSVRLADTHAYPGTA